MRIALLFAFCSVAACGPNSEGVLKLREIASEDDDVPADADQGNPSLCSTANVALCDGFETTPVQSPPWTFVTGGGSVTLDTTHVYRGNQALHVQLVSTATDTAHQADLQESVVVPTPTFYMRVFVYVASTAPQYIVRLASLSSPSSAGSLSGQSVTLMLNDQSPLITGPADTGRSLSATAIPLDTWTCLGWDVNLTESRARVLINDEAVAELALKTGVSFVPSLFDFGLAFTANTATTPAFEVWYDEIAVDPEQVGCDR